MSEHSWSCTCSACAQGGGRFEATAEGDQVTGGASAPTFTLQQVITQLQTQWGGTQEGRTWTWTNATVIEYSISDGTPTGQSEGTGYRNMTAGQIAAARDAFELWDDLIAISLNETNDQNEQITFNYSSTTQGGGTYASFNGTTSGSNYSFSSARIWLNSSWTSHDTDADMYYGGYGIITYIHEIGHALGLSHGGTYNAGSGGQITYATSAEYAQDTRQYTVMSYFDADEAGNVDHYGSNGTWRYAQTPMLHDVAAIQAKYGADTTTRTGNTVYGFNSTADRAVYNFAQNYDPIVCIWDAGGIDTLDVSGYSTNQLVNLGAGTYSNVGYMTYNVSIAYGATIENAVGGSGHDYIYGNDVGNRISGGAGNDNLFGLGGDDVIDGGLGTDTIYLGSGADTVLIWNPGAGTDSVGDFDPTYDTIDVYTPALFALSGTARTSISFAYNTATSYTATLIYNTTYGWLDWDPDGLGSASAVRIADLQDGVVITWSDIHLSGQPGQQDFNGDGTDDVLWRSSSGQLAYWGMSNGSLGSTGSLGNLGSSWQLSGVGDFGGDGTTDLLWRNSSTQEVGSWRVQNGASAGWTSYGTVSTAWQVVETGDFNGDGTDDILWRNASTQEVVGWNMQNGAVAGSASYGAVGAAWQVEATGDFNGDGSDDILWRNSSTQEVGTWTMRNGGNAGWTSFGVVTSAWQVADVGDFDGDGDDDVLWRNTTTQEVGYWASSNGQNGGWRSFGAVSSTWQIAEVGDFNGDGDDDILWRNTSTQEVGVWSTNNGSLSAWTSYGVQSADWQIVG